jgi:hypothetical protein
MHRSIRFLTVLASLALFAAAVAAAAPNDLTDEKSFAHTIRPRQIAEECVKLAAGQSITYSFEATAVVDFNIHFHKGDEVVYPVKHDLVRRGDDRFAAGSAEDYCLMWTNKTSEIVTGMGRLAP